MPSLRAEAAATPRRPIALEDFARLRDVSDPQLSPDGRWVAYVVQTTDVAADKRLRHLWLASTDGRENRALTSGDASESLPRWSPDGRSLGFVSDRGVSDEVAQLWLLPMAGGEAQRLTTLPGDVTDYAWSPDGQRIVLAALDADATSKSSADSKPMPRVIDRYYFKEDITGYLSARRQHLYLLDTNTRAVTQLLTGAFDEARPSWSPDGRHIAFVSKRSADADRVNRFGIYVMEPSVQAPLRLVTEFEGEGADTEWASAPQWSPDGQSIVYVAGGDPKLIYYSVHQLMLVSSAGGAPRALLPTLDRNVTSPRFTADGKAIRFLREDDGNVHLMQLRLQDLALESLLPGRRSTSAFDIGPKNLTVVLESTPQHPEEIFLLTGKVPRSLSRQNDALMSELQLGTLEEIRFPSADGTDVHGFMLLPPNFNPAVRHPTLLRLHGGARSRNTRMISPSSDSGLRRAATWCCCQIHAAAPGAERPTQKRSMLSGARKMSRTCSARSTMRLHGAWPTRSGSAWAAGATAAC